MFVSYCQYEVFTTRFIGSRLDIYTVGDDLVHPGGPSVCTAFTGVHTGDIEIDVVVHDGPPPDPDRDEWDAASETTLWSPDGRLFVMGLMGERSHDVTSRPGLVRVRVLARDRIHESVRTDDDPPEQHEVHIWPVDEETGLRTIFEDGSRGGWVTKPGKAAEWAMTGLVTRQREAGPDLASAPRVSVVRPAVIELGDRVLPAGDLEIHVRAVAEDEWTWEWRRAPEPIFPDPLIELPDDRPTTIRLQRDTDGELTLRHENVPGPHAVTLGLIWDHLLDDPARPAWEAPLIAEAAKATALAEDYRRRNEERLARMWSGPPPSQRVRSLVARARPLAKLDRRLLDRLADLPPERQREIAYWSARRAVHIAGLDRIEWITEALDADEMPLTDFHAAFNRLLADPRLPPATVAIPGGPSNMLQAAAAFPAVLALANADPLAAAVDATYTAAISHGADYPAFLAEVATLF
ncbi:hypothetical protein AB0M02_27770 [Actinoplanes sp. NPDC051861]|uniref:hypothetical protein n=1 Tax=Actinoplanes sp. NPDC051861 TaxID=3155170 RepID=UPI003448DAB9